MSPSNTHKNIIICADDFAQNTSISKAIIALSIKGKISATSCMTNSPNWKEHAALLKPIKNIDKGVHLNFTHSMPLSPNLKEKIHTWPSSLLTVIHWLITKKLNSKDIELEIEYQLCEFENCLNQVPDFIDGHQHIHHFPIIRNALLTVYKKKYSWLPLSKKPYIRIASSRPHLSEAYWLKKKIIQWLGSERLKKSLLHNAIPFNQHFAGVYPFNHKQPYETIITDILSIIKNNSILMCHPGMESKDKHDPIALSRIDEYNYLLGHKFDRLCQINNITVSRFDRSEY